MTYSIDLARNIFYADKPEYALAVLHPTWLDLAVTVAPFVAFTVFGTYFFVRGDRERWMQLPPGTNPFVTRRCQRPA